MSTLISTLFAMPCRCIIHGLGNTIISPRRQDKQWIAHESTAAMGDNGQVPDTEARLLRDVPDLKHTAYRLAALPYANVLPFAAVCEARAGMLILDAVMQVMCQSDRAAYP